MFVTSKISFGLRTISLLGRDILILKAMPISDKTARFVSSQESAVAHTINTLGVRKTHTVMYTKMLPDNRTVIKNPSGLIETVYRRDYK